MLALGPPPEGSREAFWICTSVAFTKSLDVVPKAFFNRSHQISSWPSGGHTFENWSVAWRSFTRTRGVPGVLIGTTDVPATLFISSSSRSMTLYQLTQPSPLRDRLGGPVAIPEISVPLPPRRARAQPSMQATTFPTAHGWTFAGPTGSVLCAAPWCTVQIFDLSLDPLVHGVDRAF